jgi:transforming growth factor-beta-induced protein
MKHLFKTLFALVLSAQLSAQTVWDIISTSPDHQTLTVAIQTAGLEGTLDGPGTFTVFAPTDDAFVDALTALGISAGDLLASPSLSDILLYHVLGSTVLSGDLSNGLLAQPLNMSNTLKITIDGSDVFINQAQVTAANLSATNGVVHVLNGVVLPGQTVADIAIGSAAHTVLVAAVVEARLLPALTDPFAQFTVFAPTDAAFVDALTALGISAEDLLASPSLTDILLYHVIGAEVMSGDLSNGLLAQPLNNSNTLKVTIDGSDVFINQAQVVLADLAASNGVVHVLDAVVLPGQTVADIAIGSAAHTVLVAAVVEARLLPALTNPFAQFTVFAPTDAAFADALTALGISAEDLLASPSLTDILLYHVIGAEVMSGDLSNGLLAQPLNNSNTLKVTIDGSDVFINQAQVVLADLGADNGVVHVLDAVVLPGQTVADVAIGSSAHTVLVAAVVEARLLPALTNPFAQFTLFAPTDEAFINLLAELEITAEDLLASPELTNVLLYHVVGAQALSTDLEDGMMIETLVGLDVTVTINANGVFINDAEVILADLGTSNGVVHVLDAVLIPVFPEPVTVWDIISTSDVHTTLTTAIELAGLDGALQGDGPFTVFAPTNDAFALIPAEVLNAILADNELLTAILLYHVVGAEAFSTDLSDGMMIETLVGLDVTVTINADGIFINDAEVILADLVADNGVVHVIDAVLVPVFPEPVTVWDIISNSPDHTTLATAIGIAGLQGALEGPGPLTVFAPTNAAFNALPADVLAEVLADPALLTNILLYHVVGAQALSSSLTNGQSITTLQGQNVTVNINMGTVMINSATVTAADLLADNGVVHVINGVLLPPTFVSESANSFEAALFPNPASDILNVRFSGSEGAFYQIFDLQGRKAAEGRLNGVMNNINISSLNAGSYAIRLFDQGFDKAILFVIE